MIFVIIFIFIIFIVGCAPAFENSSGEPVKAIYLVQGDGQLSQEYLQTHPEVILTNSFDDFKKLAHAKVALWIDINAVGLVDLDWLGESPQRFYPVVLIGIGDEVCSFFEIMQYFSFSVPCCLNCSSPVPGFSVNILTSEPGGSMHGYKQTPTVQDILEITNPLLESVK